jgi:hypothetical protein
VKTLSHENELDLHENEPVGGTHFHMNGFARRFALTRRQKATRKWPIDRRSIPQFHDTRSPVTPQLTPRQSPCYQEIARCGEGVV